MKKLKNVGIILGFGIVATGLFFKPDRIWANQNVQVEQSMNQDSTRSAEVERYIKDLKSKDPNVRVNAVMALHKIGDVRAVPYLIEALKDENEWVRGNAALALGGIGDERAVPYLIEALKDENEWVRVNAVMALHKIGDVRAVPGLIDALKDKNEEVRGNAALALGGIGDERAIPYLIEALKDKDKDVRWRASEAIGKIAEKGGDCSAAVPGLIDALKDEWVRVNAVMALGEIGDERAVPGLIDALKDKNWLVRWRASEALGKIAKKGQDISPAIEALKNVADNDEYPLVREAAREALRAAGVE